jgi:hypothetical protein
VSIEIIFASGNATMFFSYALLFWYGATLITAGEINFNQLMTAILALMLGALGLNKPLMALEIKEKGH